MGDPRDAGTNLGPLISAKQMERVLSYIRVRQSEGAETITGGARGDFRGMAGQSGIGPDLGRTALDNYTEQKVTWLQRTG
jgi:acyl-CoA reductase-like NAD-dependent aldehyde dehydrogenase